MSGNDIDNSSDPKLDPELELNEAGAKLEETEQNQERHGEFSEMGPNMSLEHESGDKHDAEAEAAGSSRRPQVSLEFKIAAVALVVALVAVLVSVFSQSGPANEAVLRSEISKQLSEKDSQLDELQQSSRQRQSKRAEQLEKIAGTQYRALSQQLLQQRLLLEKTLSQSGGSLNQYEKLLIQQQVATAAQMSRLNEQLKSIRERIGFIEQSLDS